MRSRASWMGIFKKVLNPATKISFNICDDDLLFFCLISFTAITTSLQHIYLIINLVSFSRKFCCCPIYPELKSYQNTCFINLILVSVSVTFETSSLLEKSGQDFHSHSAHLQHIFSFYIKYCFLFNGEISETKSIVKASPWLMFALVDISIRL